MLFSVASTVLGLVALTQAIDHSVVVGGPGGVVAFNPPSVSAAVGDTVTFAFQQKNHTVTQSSFASPCTPLEGGFDSGFQSVAADVINGPFPAASLVIENTDPVWIYCRQRVPASHCAAGMVFAINPGDGQLSAFQAAAKATGSSNNATATTASSSADATSTAPTTSSASSTASASTTPTDHKVLVGDGGSLSYSPANLTVPVGDTITFEFRAKNHTISQSSFAAPCRLLAATSGTSGFDSSFMPVPANSSNFPIFTITVNDTKPIWAYCRQTNPSSHCGAGMVFAANADESSSKSFAAFVALAKQLNGTNTNSTTNSNSTASSSHSNAASTSAGQSAVALLALALGVLTVL